MMRRGASGRPPFYMLQAAAIHGRRPWPRPWPWRGRFVLLSFPRSRLC